MDFFNQIKRDESNDWNNGLHSDTSIGRRDDSAAISTFSMAEANRMWWVAVTGAVEAIIDHSSYHSPGFIPGGLRHGRQTLH